MNELDTMKRARMYLGMMAEGKNPLTGEKEPEGSALNLDRISRCLSYVAGVLDKVIEAGGEVRPAPVKRVKRTRPFAIEDEQLDGITTEPKPISISALLQKVNALIPEDMKKLSYRQTVRWLASEGLMETHENDQGRTTYRPTEQGKAAGIVRSQLTAPGGRTYWANLLSVDAQISLLMHIPDIAADADEQDDGSPDGIDA